MTMFVEEIMDTKRNSSDEKENIGETQATKFEELLDEYEYDRPRRGQIVEGEVIRVYEDMILVDIGAKRDAVIPKSDLSNFNDEYLDNLSRGDHIPVYVFRAPTGDGELLVSLDKGLEQEDWDQAKEYYEDGTVSELEVVGFNKGGLLVRFGRLEGFVPNSHIIDIRRGVGRQERDTVKADMIGQKLECKVLEVDQRQTRLLFSERDAQQELRERRLRELEKGQVVTGKVVNLVNFGAFIDLEGVDGLVHISELAWERVGHPSEVVNVGDEIEVEVMDVDVERERVSLSRKVRLPSPWDQVQAKYKPGDLIEGKVTNVRDFGAFVKLQEGVVGLVHVSEIGFGGGGNPKELVKRGDTVLARIMDIEPKKERMSLSMQRVTYDEQIAWMVDHVDESEGQGELSQFAAAMQQAVKEDQSGARQVPAEGAPLEEVVEPLVEDEAMEAAPVEAEESIEESRAQTEEIVEPVEPLVEDEAMEAAPVEAEESIEESRAQTEEIVEPVEPLVEDEAMEAPPVEVGESMEAPLAQTEETVEPPAEEEVIEEPAAQSDEIGEPLAESEAIEEAPAEVEGDSMEEPSAEAEPTAEPPAEDEESSDEAEQDEASEDVETSG
jgi:small subunit ribosomal protein S1